MSADEMSDEKREKGERIGTGAGGMDPDIAAYSPSVDEAVVMEMRRRSRRAFLVGGLAAVAGYGGWRWLRDQSYEGGTPYPFRRVLEANESLWSGLFDGEHPAPTYPRRLATMPKLNGSLGIDTRIDPAGWRLRVFGLGERSVRLAPDGRLEEVPMILTLDDVMALPRVEMTTELMCIEGWSAVVYWTGARLSDFVARYASLGRRTRDLDLIAGQLPPYVALETPDRGYYVGLDIASALHPQTLLCWAMGGKPLTPAHGAPLRLVIPTKYGIKNIKQIGAIRFTGRRPSDYWAERGYDWYAGL